ncbi:MAG: hypothetical protein F6K62_19125 [Sphaerospermopsis sp. SIO1G2]|nr:hypothetical protein [Sphaerospermopsis sp. SIO1G1]NET72963.1 hypothetical protein [Sphaerospermopsis sp. SIO1G2]
MNIADTSNNGTAKEILNSANSSELEQTNCPFYSVLNDENKAGSNLPLLNPATDDLQDQPQQDWIAEPDIEKQIQVDSEFQKLLILNGQLQAANDNLYAQVEQLKQELAEAEKILQWQKKRSTVTESILSQQAQDLTTSQKQIHSLFQQLEAATQTVHNQEMFINTHKSQLQISQERVAQLERECTLLQTKYSEQSQNLLSSENTCRELSTRLIRQQRQTLQFKAALEKCLDTTVPNSDSLDDEQYYPHDVTIRSTRFSRKARSLFSYGQPIQPWSAEEDGVADNCHSVDQHLDNFWMQDSIPDSYSSDHSDPVSTPKNLTDLTDDQQISASIPEVAEFDEQMIDTTPVPESNLDRQLESLIDMFFTSPTSSHPLTVTENLSDYQDQTTLQNGEILPLESTPEQQEKITEEFQNLDPTSDQDTDVSSLTDLTLMLYHESLVNDSVPEQQDHFSADLETQDYWSDSSFDDLNLQSPGEYYLHNQSPSPLIYPQRPPKGRKSLASVELPNFPSSENGQKSDD